MILKIISNFFSKNRNRKLNKRISYLSFIDNNSTFYKNVVVTHFCKIKNTEIGSYSYIGNKGTVNYCKIGRYCSIGPSVKIGLGKHPTHMVSTSPLFYTEKNIFNLSITDKAQYEEYGNTIIGNDVWIGANVLIMDGIKIGDGAIIAAGSVVTKNVPEYAIVGGVPAKLIKYRFNEEIIKKLKDTKWWEKDIDELEKYKGYFENIEGFIERYAKDNKK